MELRFAAARRNAQLVANLFVGIPLNIMEDKDGAGATRQPADRIFQIDFVGHGDIARCANVGVVHFLRCPTVMNRHRLATRERHIHRDSVQPGGKRCVSPKTGQLVPHANKHVLRDFLSQYPIAQHPRTQGIDPIDVDPV